MASIIKAKYLGNKKMELEHMLSGSKIMTDAPPDNNGEGKYFSPTDLVAGALGACVMTILAIHAERDEVSLAGMHMEAEKHMANNPRRIAPLIVKIHLPKKLSLEYREKLERAGNNCPVHHSLKAECNATVAYLYDL